MASSRMFATIFVFHVLCFSQVEGVQKVTVTSAMRFIEDSLMLISDNDYLLLYNNVELLTGRTSDLQFPQNVNANAVLRHPRYDKKYYLYVPGSYYEIVVDQERTFKTNYNPRSKRTFFGNGGPDAVATADDKVFFFKGCKLVREKRWARHENVKKYGLPCNPDAAWNSGGKIVVLKGDQIWTWNGADKADGPNPFSSVYTITSWELIPRES